MTRRTHIMVHHSATVDGATFSWPAIRRFHVETNGWRAIGYHAGVELIQGAGDLGVRYEALIGRALHVDAAACPQGDMNSLALHVCVVGNFDQAPPAPAALELLIDVVLWPWMKIFEIPAARVVGHRDFNPHKTCPGRRFDLDALRARLH